MKLLKPIFKGIFLLLISAIVVYFLGPQMKFEKFDNLPNQGVYSINEIEDILTIRNDNVNIKEGNEEKIVWQNEKVKSEFAVVYLHGFSASHQEGFPIHINIANHLKANLLLTRLPYHGLNDSLAFKDFSPKTIVEYAKNAIKIGKSIGEKVIVVSCSTGGTLSAYLSAKDSGISAQIMFSPNFELQDKTTNLLTKPWGLQIARKVKGSKYHEWNTPLKARPYWYHKYRLEGVIGLQNLLNETMKDELFTEIEQPTFIGYFYKNEELKDRTISIDRIKEVEKLLQAKSSMNQFIAYPNGRAHVFISPLYNPDWQDVQKDVFRFLDKTFNYVSVLEEIEI